MITGNAVVDVLLTVAAAITATGLVITALRMTWRGFFRPIIRAAQKVNETLPVVMSIAEEFTPDGGKSLHDVITKMASDAEVLSAYAHTAKHDTIDAVATLQGWQDHHGERLEDFIDETKTRFEELGAEVTAVKTDMATVMTIIDRRDDPR